MNLITRFLQFDNQRRLPPQYLLFYSRTPNNWLDVGWEGDFGWDSDLSAWSIPRTVTDWTGTERDMFTILGVGLFFDAAGNSLVVTGAQILAWTGINQYHMLFSLTKGLVIYDPYAVTDAVVVKADKFMRQPVYSDIPTIFFNGCDITGSSGFDSGVLGTNPGQWVPDYLGNLVNAGVDVPAMQGMRLATTLADGAVLGPELELYGDFSAGISTWTSVNCTPVVGVDGVTCTVTGSYASLQKNKTYTIGDKYLISVEYDYGTVPANKLAISFGIGIEFVIPGSGTGMYDFYITPTSSYTKLVVGVLSGVSAGKIFRYAKISVKKITPTYYDTALDGTPLLPSVSQPTRTFDAGFTTPTPGPTFKRYTRSNPATDMPGYLSEPVRSTFAKLPAVPATQTTASLALGTYCLWVEGTGSFQASAGTAAATDGFGAAAVAGSPVTFTITTAGTVVLTKSGTVTWVQLELGAFPTSRIDNPLSVSSVTRAGTVLSFPTLGKIRPNNQAYWMTVVPRATGQVGTVLWGTYTDANNYTAVIIDPTTITYRKCIAGVSTDATVSVTHTKDTPILIEWAGSLDAGMIIAAKQYSGGVWAAWTDGALVSSSAGKANAIIGATEQRGSLNNTLQFTGNISELETLDIPLGIPDPLAWAKAQWGLPA